MRAAFAAHAPEDSVARFELRDVSIPSLDGLPAGSVLIKTVASSICGSDLWGRGGSAATDWRKQIDYLRIKRSCCGGSGHECIGEIAAVVEPCRFAVGDRVLAMVTSYISAVQSVRVIFEAETGFNASDLPKQGCFADYFISHQCASLLVPVEALASIPAPFDPRWIIAAQPLGTIIHACKKLPNCLGKTVAVLGCGQNGLVMAQMLGRLGARRVICVDLLPSRVAAARRVGKATHALLSQGGPAGFAKIAAEVEAITMGEWCDVAVDMVGHQDEVMNQCAELVKRQGIVLLFGLPPAKEETGFTIQFAHFKKNIRYLTSHSPAMDCFELALELIAQRRFDVEGLFTHIVPFARFPEAYKMASDYTDDVIKTMVTYSMDGDEPDGPIVRV